MSNQENVFETIMNYKTVFQQIEEFAKIKAYEIMPSYSDRRSKRTISPPSYRIQNVQI